MPKTLDVVNIDYMGTPLQMKNLNDTLQFMQRHAKTQCHIHILDDVLHTEGIHLSNSLNRWNNIILYLSFSIYYVYLEKFGN